MRRRDPFYRYYGWRIETAPMRCAVDGEERWMLVRRWKRAVAVHPRYRDQLKLGFFSRVENGPVIDMEPFTGVLPK